MPEHPINPIISIGRYSVAAVFLLSGILPLFNQATSFALLTPLTDSPVWQTVLFYAMVVMDIGLGILACCTQSKRIWQAMLVMVLSYTLVCSMIMPQLWLEPLGSLLKNITILSWLWVLAFYCPTAQNPMNR